VGSLLAEIEVFKVVPPEVQHRLERGGRAIQPHDGEQVFAQGDPADAIYAVIGGDGRVRIGSVDRRGKRLMVEVIHTGDIFGEIGVIDGGVRTADAYVEGRISLLRIAASRFLEALANEPSLGTSLCRVFANRLRRTFMLLEDATFEKVPLRCLRWVG
jgi:CRP/FNR family cyclic AMP-dependent transcriptional regulator